MMRYLAAILLGAGGLALLLALGFWQLDRLKWKEAVLAQIEAQMLAEPALLPDLAGIDLEQARYKPVRVAGRTTERELLVLSGMAELGPGYEVITAFETTTGRRILLDRGFVAEVARRDPRPPVHLSVTGNLHWPCEADSYTPAPDTREGIWFARDVSAMAAALGTEPLMVVVRGVEGAALGIVPVPVDTSAIPNDHLHYAITWFSLALVWVGMTVLLVWRIRQGTN